jgi:hypothetical protein
MTSDDIVAVEVQETDFGEKVVIDSPFDAKDFIKLLPWKAYGEEVAEYGSLGGKSRSRGDGVSDIAIQAVEDYAEEVGFTDSFSTHVSWDPEALGQDGGAWTIDADSMHEAFEFFEFCGFDTENQTAL